MESGQRRIAPYLGAYGDYRFAADNALPSGQPVLGIGNGWFGSGSLNLNQKHGGWVLLAPERVFKADTIAAEIINRCTGEGTVRALSTISRGCSTRRANTLNPRW
jgi:hypothetical protein